MAMDRLEMEIVPLAGGWVLVENGRSGTTPYATREAAFEAVVGSISNALKEGLAVSMTIDAVPGRTLE